MSTLIKRLSQNNQEFVPITLQEAVVVNTTSINSLKSLGITTLDKVLRQTLNLIDNKVSTDALNSAVQTINQQLANKQNTLTPGTGIEITSDGTINCTVSLELYKIVDSLPTAGKDCLNNIYLLYNETEETGNVFTEYICFKNAAGNYFWEKVGSINADSEVNLSDYVTKTQLASALAEINTKLDATITAVDATTSTGAVVVVSYDIPNTLYDSAVSDSSDNIV